MTTDRFIIEQRRSLEDPAVEADNYLVVTDQLGKLPLWSSTSPVNLT